MLSSFVSLSEHLSSVNYDAIQFSFTQYCAESKNVDLDQEGKLLNIYLLVVTEICI